MEESDLSQWNATLTDICSDEKASSFSSADWKSFAVTCFDLLNVDHLNCVVQEETSVLEIHETSTLSKVNKTMLTSTTLLEAFQSAKSFLSAKHRMELNHVYDRFQYRNEKSTIKKSLNQPSNNMKTIFN
jgi:hypothetical protein